jgi:cytoskeleton protein RodZ
MDERAALEELERLRQAIERYRSQRKAVDEEFEQFVRAFKAPPDAQTLAPAAASSPAPEARRVVSPAPSDAAAPIPVPVPPARRQTRPTPGVLIGLTLALLASAWLVVWTLRPRAPESTTTNTPAPVALREPGPPPVTTAAAASELTTVRAVWVRVLADGKRVLERELPPDARVPVDAEKTIVIRTGDAGAIRLTIRGQDKGFLGRAGEVVTRTFNVPPPRAR